MVPIQVQALQYAVLVLLGCIVRIVWVLLFVRQASFRWALARTVRNAFLDIIVQSIHPIQRNAGQAKFVQTPRGIQCRVRWGITQSKGN